MLQVEELYLFCMRVCIIGGVRPLCEFETVGEQKRSYIHPKGVLSRVGTFGTREDLLGCLLYSPNSRFSKAQYTLLKIIYPNTPL